MATEQEWRSRIAAWRASGLTGKQFAADKTYSVHSLFAWRRRLSATPTPTPPALRIARVIPAPSPSPTITIERAGFRITLTGAFDARTFDEVLSSLGRR
jgi:hypothetical protein